jgi:hypothetical protein
MRFSTRNVGFAAGAIIFSDILVARFVNPPALVTDSLVVIGFSLAATWAVMVIKHSSNILIKIGAGLLVLASAFIALAGLMYGISHLH